MYVTGSGAVYPVILFMSSTFTLLTESAYVGFLNELHALFNSVEPFKYPCFPSSVTDATFSFDIISSFPFSTPSIPHFPWFAPSPSYAATPEL